MDAFDEWINGAVTGLTGLPYVKSVDPDPVPLKINAPDGRLTAYVCGCYTLVSNGIVVYVGQSKNVYSRIGQHMMRAPFEFDEFTIHPCDVADLLLNEAEMIHRYQPSGNRMFPAYAGIAFEHRGSHSASGSKYR